MKKRFYKAFRIIFSLVLFGATQSASADIILLIHGFQSDVLTWKRSNVIAVLEKHGWQTTDYLIAAPQGLIPIHTPEKNISKNKIVSLQLNSEIELKVQANMVTAALYYLGDTYPNESVIIVGHSLGGLTARLSLVKNGAFQVKALVTIASPHLGTGLASMGLEELNDNFFVSSMKRMFSGQYSMLERSRPVLYDILPERPGSMLYALNRRPHPDIAYYSVVRSTRDGRLGDNVVPGYSQDMKSVAAIRNRSTRILQGFQHELTAQDAYSILNVVDALKTQ